MTNEQRARDRAEWDYTPETVFDYSRTKNMSQMKNYLLRVLELCSEEQFGQDAVEWAIQFGIVQLTYDLEMDLRQIMGEPGQPETGKYDQICDNYRRWLRDQEQRAEFAEDEMLLHELWPQQTFDFNKAA
jgi:hypothetical protein